MDKLFVDMLLSPEHITWMAEPNITVLSIETIVLFALSIAQVVIAIELISEAPAVSRFLRKFKVKLR